MRFHVLIEQDETGVYCASVPYMPGCVSDGATHIEAMANIQEAMSLWLESQDAMAAEALPSEQRTHLILLAPEFTEQAQAA